jgi:hypothetical protein
MKYSPAFLLILCCSILGDPLPGLSYAEIFNKPSFNKDDLISSKNYENKEGVIKFNFADNNIVKKGLSIQLEGLKINEDGDAAPEFTKIQIYEALGESNINIDCYSESIFIRVKVFYTDKIPQLFKIRRIFIKNGWGVKQVILSKVITYIAEPENVRRIFK